jgi:hypothetical protein
LESSEAGDAFLESQVVGFSRGAKGANENWPISHIFPPFLTLLSEKFYRGNQFGRRRSTALPSEGSSKSDFKADGGRFGPVWRMRKSP